LASSADEKTLVICLISGGGSALMPLPVDGVTLEDKQETTKVLLACGATIHEINTIRKHLSFIKGGGLAKAVYPATLITLILSDVVGDDLDSIASGPCVPDSRTFADCRLILRKYAIETEIPSSVVRHIDSGIAGKVPETPGTGQVFFEKTQNVVVGSNFNALLRAKEKADLLGYNTLLISSMLEGETRDVAANHIAIAREIQLHGLPLLRPACLLSGGETTVRIRGTGKGGRNQEFVLAAAIKMSGMNDVLILSAGTDGNDGPTDAAGAIADHSTLERAVALGLDPSRYLDNNDSYNFFDKLGDLYKTGPTNTNVMDLRIVLVG
ncbi:MAG: glycerate kinase, partial [Deltaproteobacteria bacterium]|nr:glycerate kinase [Deltaproteobacteria bacterium]